MTEQNCNPNAPKALPISTYPLMDFNKLYILRSKVLNSLVINLPQDNKRYQPERSVFKHPIQVVVLGIDGDEVKLGVYAHPRISFERGPEPNEQWRQQWQVDCDGATHSPSPMKSAEPPFTCQTGGVLTEDNATDELAALAEAHYFLHQAIEALFDSYETRAAIDWSLAKAGFAQCRDWLLLRESQVRDRVGEPTASG